MVIGIIIGVVIAVAISVLSSYALAATLVNSKNVYYSDASGLMADNVQDAIDGTCTKFSDQITNLKKEVEKDVLNKTYPIGSIYISTSMFSVKEVEEVIGGEWEVYGTGKTLVGIDTNQTEFNTIDKSGGAKSVSYTPAGSVGGTTLTTDQIPSHTHSYDKAGANTGSHTLTIAEIPSHNHELLQQSGAYMGYAIGSGPTFYDLTGGFNFGYTANTGGGGGHTHPISTASTATGAAGGGGAHSHSFTGTEATISTLQPYVTVYMYRRKA